MKSAAKEKIRSSGPTRSYLQTCIRASRLLNAARILALIELTRRLHQAYAQAYDKHAAEWLLPQNPQVGGTNDKGKIKDFNNAFNEAVSRLDNEACWKLFGGKDAALKALRGANYSYQDLDRATKDPNTGAISAVGAATNSATNPPSVYINNYGPFRNTTVLVVTSSGVESHTFDFGTKLRGSQFGALLLLHELGHLVGIFGPDAKNPQLNRSYTQQVQDACFPKKK